MADNLKYKTKVGIYWSTFAQVSNFAMNFIVGIVMARLLTPEDYGITALPAVFMSIAQVFIEGGFSSALVRKEEVTEDDLSTAFYYSIIVGIVCYFALFFASPFIADFYNIPILEKLIRITALVFIWAPLTTPLNVILSRRLDFKTPARITVINRLVSGALGIYVAYIGWGLWALVIANISSSLLGLIQTWFAVKWRPTKRWNKESFKYLWGYGNKLIATHLINTLYGNIGPIFMGKFGGARDLGNYNRAKQYASLPPYNFVGILTNVSFPVLSKMQDDDKQLEHNYRRMIRMSAFVVFPIMFLIAALARPLVIAMITEKWESCIYLLQILCFVFMLQPIHLLNINVLQVKGRTDLTLKLEIIKKTIGTVLFITALRISVVAFCYADLLMSLIALVLNTYYTGKLINVGFAKQVRDMVPTLLICTVMFLSVFFSIKLIENNIIQILVGGILGGAIYLGLAILFKFEELNDVKYMLSRRKK